MFKQFFLQHGGVVCLVAVLAIGGALAIGGCLKKTAAGTPATLQPGAVDAFDQWAFDQLGEVKAGIDEAKQEYTAGNLPANAKMVIDQAINAYNLAEGLAQRYHDSGGKSVDAATLQSEITGDILSIVNFVAELKAAAAQQKTAAAKKS